MVFFPSGDGLDFNTVGIWCPSQMWMILTHVSKTLMLMLICVGLDLLGKHQCSRTVEHSWPILLFYSYFSTEQIKLSIHNLDFSTFQPCTQLRVILISYQYLVKLQTQIHQQLLLWAKQLACMLCWITAFMFFCKWVEHFARFGGQNFTDNFLAAMIIFAEWIPAQTLFLVTEHVVVRLLVVWTMKWGHWVQAKEMHMQLNDIRTSPIWSQIRSEH